MSTGLDTFDKTVQESNLWLKDVMKRLDTRDRHHAYSTLRAVLHALRDRIGPESAAHLGAQLPMLLCGLFYEGLGPYGKAQQGASRARDRRSSPISPKSCRARQKARWSRVSPPCSMCCPSMSIARARRSSPACFPRSCANSGLPSSRRRRGSGSKARLERCSGRVYGRRQTKYC